MSKPSEPWFYNQTGWWMTWIDGKKIKLAKGKKNKAAARGSCVRFFTPPITTPLLSRPGRCPI